MLKTPIPLVTFCSNVLPVAKRAGYKVVLTALAREVDALSFYADVKRYWTSLDDLTGPYVLFLFAGAGAADRLDASRSSLESFTDGKIYFNANLAIRGQNAHQMFRWRPLRYLTSHLVDQYDPHFERDWREPAEDFPAKHTSELFELRQFMGIKESQLPCLVFTLCKPPLRRNSCLERHIIPFSSFADRTIYLFLKQLMESWEHHFQVLDDVYVKSQELLHDKKRIESRHSVPRALQVIRRETELVHDAVVKKAVAHIIARTEAPTRCDHDRAKCYVWLALVKRAVKQEHGLVSELKRLIDLTIPLQKPRHCRVYLALPNTNDIEDINQSLREIAQKTKNAWNGIVNELIACKQASTLVDSKLDFFICYAHPDECWAESLYNGLRRLGHPFLDKFCLIPGDNWTHKIRQAQDSSACTVVVVTENTPKSWFAESEYVHAIHLARTCQHRVVPVLCGQQPDLPYGLEQLNALALRSLRDINRVCTDLLDSLEGPITR